MPSKLVCPLCGAYTALSPLQLKGKGILLDNSDKDSVYYRDVALYAIPDESHMRVPVGETSYAILTCEACGRWFVAKKQEYEEWLAVYPIPHKPVAEEIPEPIKSEFEEACLCLAMGAYRAGVSMCQIALEALWRKQKVPDLQALYKQGTISKQLCERANEIRRWGNVAKHEPIPDVVSEEDARQLLTYLDAILDHVYVQPASLDALKQKRKEAEQKPS